nr:hypothetical protein [Tanacetum cinerariifolium]
RHKMHISQQGGSGTDEGTGEDEEPESDGESEEEETTEKEEKSFDPIPRTPEESKDDGNGEEGQGLRISEEERIQEEEEADELYRDVNINQGRGLQVSQDIKDSHVTLTPTHSDGQQESSSTSSFVTNLLDPIIDPDMVKLLEVNFSNIPESVNAQLEAKVLTRSSHSSRTSYAVAADLSEIELKKILIDKMEGNKSIQRSDEQRYLYKALVEAYDANKTILDTYGESAILKRRHEEDDDQEGPSAGSDRGSTTWTQSRQLSASESDFTEEPVQTTCQMEEPSHSVFETGAEDQPIVQTSQHPEWFSQPRRPPTPDCDWNKSLPATQGNAYLTELEYHLEEVYKATTDQLDWDNPEGQQYPHNLLQPLPLIPDNRGRCVILFEHFINNDLDREGVSHWGRKRQQFYRFVVNRESALDVYSKRRIIAVTYLKIVEWHNYKHLDWISLSNLTVEERFAFNVSLRMFTRSIVIQRRVKDLQLGVESYQKRLNLIKPDTYQSDLKQREAYTAYSNPRGFIYQNRDKKNRLMRIDELHKFSDGTLNDVRNALANHNLEKRG